MLYKLRPGDTIQSVAHVFGYDDYKDFFKNKMHYANGDHSFMPGTIVEAPCASESSRDRPYDGQEHTDNGERGKTFVEGLTMRDVADCYYIALLRSSGDINLNRLADAGNMKEIKHAMWHRLDFADLDPAAIQQNLTCEIEKMMGIFPNLPEYRHA